MASSAIGSFIIGVSPIPGFSLGAPLGDFVVGDDGIALELPPVILQPISFFAIEIEIYKPGSSLQISEGHGTRPHGALVQFGEFQSSGTLFASDAGYRTAAADPNGVVAYPPLLAQVFQIDVAMNLDPSQSGVAAAAGSATLSNASRQYDAIVAGWNSDARPVRILSGEKALDPARQYWTDPPYASLNAVFFGLSTLWFLDDVALTIPLRDGTYWMERIYQTTHYGGAGGYDGTAAMKGKPIPRTRGGTPAHPVRNITPTLVDPVLLIYQCNDAAGTIEHLYEGGAEVITLSSDTTNLFAGSTPAGHYRTDNSRHMFQLGSSPVHTITADVTGQFPGAGAITTWAAIAKHMLIEDILLPTANLDGAAFDAVDSAYPYIAGVYFGSETTVTGVDAIAAMFSGVNATLVPQADGTLRPLMFRATTGMAVATFNLANIIDPGCVPRPLPTAVSPPVKRVRVGYNTNYTIQTSDLNAASATAAQLQFAGLSSEIATAFTASVALAYNRPNDPPVIASALLDGADAQTVANDLNALFGVRRRLYDVTVPVSVGRNRHLGDVVLLKYPLDDLDPGRLGQIVRKRITGGDATMTFQVFM